MPGKSQVARLFNLGLFYAYCLVLFTTPIWGDSVARISSLPPEAGCDSRCYNFYTAYRLGYALVLYHLIQAAMLIGVSNSDDGRAIIQERFWIFKPFILLSLAGASFFVPYWVIDYMFWPTFICGVLFLLIQAVLLVDLSFDWAEELLTGAEKGKPVHKLTLIGSTLILSVSAIAVIGCVYWYFDRNLERGLATMNALLIIAITACPMLPSVREAIPSAGIFQSSLLGLYSLFVLMSAFTSDPDRTKDGSSISVAYPIISKVIACANVMYTFMAVAQTTFSSGSSIARFGTNTSKGVFDTSDEAAGRYNYSLFHVNFGMAAAYTILFLTFWEYIDFTGGKMKILESVAAYWVRVLASWAVNGLYMWSLFAPVILQDRSF